MIKIFPYHMSSTSPAQFVAQIKAQAREIGFELVGIAQATEPETLEHFHHWLDQGYAGEMGYLEARRGAYAHPSGVMPGVKSVIMLGLNYRHEDSNSDPTVPARVSIYAQSARDYHDVIREKLKRLGKYLVKLNPDCHTRGVVDTAPLLERDFARRAGLGWFGKNTLLINKQQGSFLFLAGLLTDWELPADEPHHTAHCGTCTRCLEACPTDAFVAPHQLDARKCISYLTIELRDQPIPRELRPYLQNWIMGCDVCQDVCPWNSKKSRTLDEIFSPQEMLAHLAPEEILALNEEEFKNRFRQTPLSRPGRTGIVRNILMALANTKNSRWYKLILPLINDFSAVIRGAAVYCLSRICSPLEADSLASNLKELSLKETDHQVIEEIKVALLELKNQ